MCLLVYYVISIKYIRCLINLLKLKLFLFFHNAKFAPVKSHLDSNNVYINLAIKNVQHYVQHVLIQYELVENLRFFVQNVKLIILPCVLSFEYS